MVYVTSQNSTESTSLVQLLQDDELITLAEAADRIGIPVTRVSDLVGAHKLAAVKMDGKLHVPALLLNDDGSVNKFAASAITVLADGGYDDEAILRYFFTADDTLPGRPIDALHGHGAREVIRRAQAMAF